MLNILKLMIVATFFGLLTACASGYKSFYTPVAGATPEEINSHRVSSAPATPSIERSAPIKSQSGLAPYEKRSYQLIGYSLFNSGAPENEVNALEQGRLVGADLVVVLDPQYTGSTTTAIPITTPTTSTSTTRGSATAYGPSGTVQAYGNATTTTYGTTTNYIPMTVNRSDYGALFFVKTRFKFGAYTDDLTDQQRQQLQTNQGVSIRTVIDDSPAFLADILPGDIILSIDDIRVPNIQAYSRMMDERGGRVVKFMLYRNGQNIIKNVRLNP